MNNLQFTIYNFKKKILTACLSALIINCALLIINCPIHAQSLGLSISPPIVEITIIPGKEITQTFTISNDGEDGMASIYIVPFRAQGEKGVVVLDENNIITDTSPYASWFKISSPVSSSGQNFYLGGGQSKNVDIQITPPKNAEEKDYYFTLLYELTNDVPGGIAPVGPTNKARIGANMLISVSKEETPETSFSIVEFSAPKIVDSLGKINFNVRIRNNGSYFLKPSGKIVIEPITGSSETLDLAPLNIVSNSIRNIPCIEGEGIISCQSNNKVLIGIYKATLKIKTDNQENYQEKTATTIAFPFSILLAVVLIIPIYKIIRYPKQRKGSY